MPLPRAGHPTARAVKASAPLKTAARRPCVVVVVVVRTPTPNYLRQASQNLGKYACSRRRPTQSMGHSARQWRRTRSHPPPQSASEGVGGARGLGNLVRPESHPEPRGFPVQWADPGVKSVHSDTKRRNAPNTNGKIHSRYMADTIKQVTIHKKYMVSGGIGPIFGGKVALEPSDR